MFSLFSNLRDLNTEQAKAVSRFFIDVAKGLFLGAIGVYGTDTDWRIKLAGSLLSMFLVIIFLGYGISFLKKN